MSLKLRAGPVVCFLIDLEDTNVLACAIGIYVYRI